MSAYASWFTTPSVTAAPNRDARAFTAKQGSTHQSGELMVCVEIDGGTVKHVFMLPLDVATKLKDDLLAALELED